MQTKLFAERISKIRTDKGFSQQKFSEISGLNQSFLSKVERNKGVPSSEFILVFYKLFDADLNWLLTGDGEPYAGKKSRGTDDGLTPGERLKKCRKLLNLTQDELSKKIHSTHGFISSAETGRFSMGAEFLYELNRQLNLNINWLLAGDGPIFLNAKRPATVAGAPPDPQEAARQNSEKAEETSQLTPEEIQLLKAILKKPQFKTIINNIDEVLEITFDEMQVLKAMRTKSYIKSIVTMADKMTDDERNKLFAYIEEQKRISDLKHGSVSYDKDVPGKKRA